MFSSVIPGNQLTTQEANAFFHNINGIDFRGDHSFVSTLRALLHEKVPEGCSVFVEHSTHSLTSENIASRPTRDMVRRIYRADYAAAGTIHICGFVNLKQENNIACMKLMETSFTDVYPSYQKLQKVTDFYAKSFGVLCFIDTEFKNVVIFVEKLDIKKWHHLQCSIFAFLPWFFDPDKGVTEDEMALIKSLEEKTSEKYLECINKIASKYDFRAMGIKKKLAGFEHRFERAEIERVNAKIRDIMNKISRYENEINAFFRQYNDENIRLLGLEAKLAKSSEDSEIMEYFICNKKLSLDDVYNGTMTFSVNSYLEYYDEDVAKTVIENDTSYVYLQDGEAYRGMSTEDMKKLMTAIFIDQTLKVRFCAAYRFEMTGGVSALGGYGFSPEFSHCMPNPHIDDYSCLGNYRSAINELLKNNNYIGALEQCVASSKSLNLHDMPVMKSFMRRMYNSRYNRKFIELPDGTCVTTTEAVAWLNTNQKQEGVTNEQNN